MRYAVMVGPSEVLSVEAPEGTPPEVVVMLARAIRRGDYDQYALIRWHGECLAKYRPPKVRMSEALERAGLRIVEPKL